jgi:putative membrane protein
MDELLVRYLHFIGIISLASGLVVEQFLISKEVSVTEMKKLAAADAMCGMGSLLILISGSLLWLAVGKPAVFYSGNWVFYTKLTIFLGIIVLAIYPAVFFIKNRNSKATVITIPHSIIILIRLELVLLFIIPLFAVFMARGYGIT